MSSDGEDDPSSSSEKYTVFLLRNDKNQENWSRLRSRDEVRKNKSLEDRKVDVT
jgi:hypothetical protein